MPRDKSDKKLTRISYFLLTCDKSVDFGSCNSITQNAEGKFRFTKKFVECNFVPEHKDNILKFSNEISGFIEEINGDLLLKSTKTSIKVSCQFNDERKA